MDLCIMGRAPREIPCRVEPFAQHPHVLVTAPGHRFARAEEVPAKALAEESFIVREADSGTRAVLQEYLDEYRIQPKFLMEMPSNEAIKQAVMAGMGVSVLSLHTLALELKTGLIVTPQVEGLPRVRRWNLIHAGTYLSPGIRGVQIFHARTRRELSREPLPGDFTTPKVGGAGSTAKAVRTKSLVRECKQKVALRAGLAATERHVLSPFVREDYGRLRSPCRGDLR